MNREKAYLALKNPKSFQSPKMGAGPQPIRAHFIHTTVLSFVNKSRQKYFGVPSQPNPGSAPEFQASNKCNHAWANILCCFSSHKHKRVGHKVNGIFSNFFTYPRISKTMFILNGGV